MSIDDTPYGDSTRNVSIDEMRYRGERLRRRFEDLKVDVVDVQIESYVPDFYTFHVRNDPRSQHVYGERREYRNVITMRMEEHLANSLLETVDRIDEFANRARHYEKELIVSSNALSDLQRKHAQIKAFLADNPSARELWEELVVMAKLADMTLKLD